jgi:hypothetical protein
MPYSLADGMNPAWAIFQKTISQTFTQKHRQIVSQQESVKKDVERAFEVLVSRWHILRNPIRLHRRKEITDVVHSCAIMHNMVVESRRDNYESELHSLTETLEGVGQGPFLTIECCSRELAFLRTAFTIDLMQLGVY